MSLNWEASYAIALQLKRRHPDIALADVSLNQIFQWTLALDDFQDDPALCNDGILAQIYQDWYEETIHDRK